MSALAGIHPVREALLAGRSVDRVLIAKGAGGPRLQEIIDLCRQKQIPVRFEPRNTIDRAANGANHQGIVAFAAQAQYSRKEDVLAGAKLVVVLDGVEDPHNLGAIIRSANAAGADAVLIPDRRAAPVTETVAKASAGAVEYTPIVRVSNVNTALNDLKNRGFWIYGLDERGTERYDQVDYTTPTALVFGGEGKGMHQLVQKHCDFLVHIPMAGQISSLNVSVAAGVVMFEWRRRQTV